MASSPSELPIETKVLQPIVLYYEDGTIEHLRVPGMGAAKDLAQLVPKLVEIAIAEPKVFILLYENPQIDETAIYKIPALGGEIQFNQKQIKVMIESYLDSIASLLKTVSGRKLEWRKMLFQPMQIMTLFFTNKLFEYIDEQANLIIQKKEEEGKEEKELDETETPSNELEAWCYSYSSLLRLAKTPRGAKELMEMTRGEIAGITKFWNIAEKRLYPDLNQDNSNKPISEMTESEKLKLLKDIEKKQHSKKMLLNKDFLEEQRNALLGNPIKTEIKNSSGFKRKKIGESKGSD